MSHRTILKSAAVFAALALCGTQSYGQWEIVSVEEDWAMKVGQPDAAKNSPQVSMTMGPHVTTDGLHFLFTLNHLSEPDYVAGGMQIQVWNGEQLVDSKNGPNVTTLHHGDEVVRWTQRLSVANGTVTFEVDDGSSQSWGAFGGQGYLKASVAGPANLNGYRPRLSLTESGVAFGGNRVSHLQLERIRWKVATGETYEMVAPIDIDADLDP